MFYAKVEIKNKLYKRTFLWYKHVEIVHKCLAARRKSAKIYIEPREPLFPHLADIIIINCKLNKAAAEGGEHEIVLTNLFKG